MKSRDILPDLEGILQDARHLITMARAAASQITPNGHSSPGSSSDGGVHGVHGVHIDHTPKKINYDGLISLAAGRTDDVASSTGRNTRLSGVSKETEGIRSLVWNQDEEKTLTREVASFANRASMTKDGPCIPLYALLFLLGDLHMKRPQDIREKVEIANREKCTLRLNFQRVTSRLYSWLYSRLYSRIYSRLYSRMYSRRY